MSTHFVHHLAAELTGPVDLEVLRHGRTAHRPPAQRAWAWSDAGEPGSCRLEVRAGVGVLTLTCPVRPEVFQECLSAFTTALGLRLDRIVVDLTAATLDEESCPVLAAMAGAARRHGVQLWFAGVPVGEQLLLGCSPAMDAALFCPNRRVALAQARAHRTGGAPH
jgi:hypothetical protein